MFGDCKIRAAWSGAAYLETARSGTTRSETARSVYSRCREHDELVRKKNASVLVIRRSQQLVPEAVM